MKYRGMSKQEKDKTGITSLKIKYNKVFGYYIEVTKSHYDKVPQHYIRKQTMVNAERYFTPELKEYEQKIINAEDKRKAIELITSSMIKEGNIKLNKKDFFIKIYTKVLGFKDKYNAKYYFRDKLFPGMSLGVIWETYYKF